MNVKELRLGNIISDYGNRIVTVNSINKPLPELLYFIGVNENNSMYQIEDVQPIPLTEEWLLKFGAEKDDDGDFFIRDPKGINMRFYLVKDFIQHTKSDCCPMANYEHVKYVHSFQNLYFALIGEELTIK